MPFKSKAQARAAFGGYLGEEMKGKAKTWAKKTPNIKNLPETAVMDAMKRKASKTKKKKTAKVKSAEKQV